MDIPRITPQLLEQLRNVKPSIDQFATVIEYYPCKVTLKDGRSFDRVYVQELESYIKHWSIKPTNDTFKYTIPIAEVARIEESPLRLPAKLADKMYQTGESGMGYCVFTLVLEDGRKLPYITGNAVDFPNLPPDVNSSMIIDLLPHEGKEELQDERGNYFHDPAQESAKFDLCLYQKI
ncbi:MAG: hypothetical protein V1701_06245 [Planctomycetota bacterium]